MVDENLGTSPVPAATPGRAHVDEPAGLLTLGHVLGGLGSEHHPPIALGDVYLIRHSFNTSDQGGLRGREDLTPSRVRDYTRYQDISTRLFPADPGRYWVVFIADGQRRSRLYCTFDNRGEVLAERTDTNRFWDLYPSAFLEPLANRLVVEWSNPRRWHRRATGAASLPVLEIADRDKVPFPGFDQVLLTFDELVQMVSDDRYADWRAALSEVQGIYLITDSSNGKQYVGKAAGAEQILQRWKSYAQDGHGGNRALRELAAASIGAGGAKTDHARHFTFSLLRVFGPGTPSMTVNDAETHFKRALMTRKFGLNRN